MKGKMNSSITKFMNLEVNMYQIAIYYNAYIIKYVFFGCGVINLNKNKKRNLREYTKSPFLERWVLVANFCAIYHIQENQL